MATRAEMKQRCKELADLLEGAAKQRDSYAELAKNREVHIANLKTEISTLSANLDNWRKIGTRLIYMIAYDLAANRTHRERNEQMRNWLQTLKDALENLFYRSELDDIPF